MVRTKIKGLIMKYYKDIDNKPYVFEDNVTPEVIARVEQVHNTTLTEISQTDYEVLIAPTFKQLRSQKIAEIKSAFNQAVTSGFTCSNGITMNSNIDDIDKLQKGYDLAVKNGLAAMDIRDFNNITHTAIALSDVDTMLLELGNNYAGLLKHKWDLIDAVNAATTQAELDAVAW